MDRRTALRLLGCAAGSLLPGSDAAAQGTPRRASAPTLQVRVVPRKYPTGMQRRYRGRPGPQLSTADRGELIGVEYSPEYLRPSGWTLHVRLAGASGQPTAPRSDVRFYEWRVERDGMAPIVLRETAREVAGRRTFIEVPTELRRRTGKRPLGPMRRDPDDEEPFQAEASFNVSLRLTRTDGGVEQRSEVFHVRDYLMAIVGDSFASGEGNPDEPGATTPVGSAQCEATTLAKATGGPIHMAKDAEWFEPAAHRSLRSGHFRALKAFEEGSEGRLVTALTFATSGAEIERGLLEPQHPWQERYGGQIAEVARTLKNANRRLDALIISIGGNDVGFAPALASLTKDKVTVFGLFGERSFGKTRSEVFADCEKKLESLPDRFNRLAREVQRLEPGAVFITEYPAGIFNGRHGQPAKGCGLFDAGVVGVSVPDAERIQQFGHRLNRIIRRAAECHGWFYVDGISTAFRSHGYCSGDSFFVGAEQSCRTQGDFLGMMHPDRRGHEVYRDRLQEALTEVLLNRRMAPRDFRSKCSQ